MEIKAPNKTLGERVRKARKDLNLTQAQLGKKIDLSQGAISGLENGRNASSRELHSIAKALGKTVEELVEGIDVKYTDDEQYNPHFQKVFDFLNKLTELESKSKISTQQIEKFKGMFESTLNFANDELQIILKNGSSELKAKKTG